jgi:hypothetical protein
MARSEKTSVICPHCKQAHTLTPAELRAVSRDVGRLFTKRRKHTVAGPGRPRAISDDLIAEIRAQRDSGVPVEQIADAYQLHPETIYRIARGYGRFGA